MNIEMMILKKILFAALSIASIYSSLFIMSRYTVLKLFVDVIN